MILLLLLLFHLIKKAEITLTQLAELACMGDHDYSDIHNFGKIILLINWNMCRSLHLECAQKSGVHHMRTCLRSAICTKAHYILGGITLVSASYIKSLIENASYRMLPSCTLPPRLLHSVK